LGFKREIFTLSGRRQNAIAGEMSGHPNAIDRSSPEETSCDAQRRSRDQLP